MAAGKSGGLLFFSRSLTNKVIGPEHTPLPKQGRATARAPRFGQRLKRNVSLADFPWSSPPRAESLFDLHRDAGIY